MEYSEALDRLAKRVMETFDEIPEWLESRLGEGDAIASRALREGPLSSTGQIGKR